MSTCRDRAPTASGGTRSCTGRSPPRRPARARPSPRPARSGHGPRRSPAACARRCRLGDQHLARRQRTPRPGPQLTGQLAGQPGHPVLPDICQGGPVDARRAVVAAHRIPRTLQDVLAVDLVSQRMEPSFRVGPGRPVKRMLQRSDSVPSDSRQGGPSRNTGTHQSAAPRSRTNEAAALPITAGCVVLRLDRYYDRLRLLPGAPPTSRLHTGYRTRPFHGHREPAPAREGLPSSRHHLNVPRPHTPGSPSRLRFQGLRASMAFAVNRPARLSRNVQRRGRLRCTLRTAQLLPLTGLSTLGSALARFQARTPACYRASWQLPGPDLHRQATTSFRSGHDRWTITSCSLGAPAACTTPRFAPKRSPTCVTRTSSACPTAAGENSC